MNLKLIQAGLIHKVASLEEEKTKEMRKSCILNWNGLLQRKHPARFSEEALAKHSSGQISLYLNFPRNL